MNRRTSRHKTKVIYIIFQNHNNFEILLKESGNITGHFFSKIASQTNKTSSNDTNRCKSN